MSDLSALIICSGHPAVFEALLARMARGVVGGATRLGPAAGVGSFFCGELMNSISQPFCSHTVYTLPSNLHPLGCSKGLLVSKYNILLTSSSSNSFSHF